MMKGDTPEAACFDSPEEPGSYRTQAHTWRPLGMLKGAEPILDVCDSCGAIRARKTLVPIDGWEANRHGT